MKIDQNQQINHINSNRKVPEWRSERGLNRKEKKRSNTIPDKA